MLSISHGGEEEDVKVYEVSSRSALVPSWKKTTSAKDKRKERLKEAKESAEGVQVLQDFELPTVSSKVKCTKDGEFILAAGTYPPMVRAYETSQLSMKFQRNLGCEIVDFQILNDDWKKIAFLLADRVIELHAAFGGYYKVRVPRFGRDLALHESSAELYVCGEGKDVYRLNLEQGRFMAPLNTKSGRRSAMGSDDDEDDGQGGNNCIGINPTNQLVAVGGENGLVEVWDPRALFKPAGRLDVGAGITAVRFESRDSLAMAVGTSVGQVLLYDIRSSRPYLVKEQGYGMPIKSVRLHSNGKHVLSCDQKSIKAWERREGTKNLFAVEPKARVNHLCTVGDSGVVLAAAETSRILSYYIPALGLAPKWCSFLDNFTEELEDGAKASLGGEDVYENYRFVTMEELQKMNLEHLVGTSLLRGYMHGYFMDLRLWRKATEAADPFAYDTYRKEMVKEKIEKERTSRIAVPLANSTVKKVKVNQKVVDMALEKAQFRKGVKADVAAAVVTDNRFKTMFEDEDFAVDEGDNRFRLLHPGKQQQADNHDVDSDLDLEEDVEEDGGSVSDGSEDDDSDGISAEIPSKKRKPKQQPRLYGVKKGTSAPVVAASTAIDLARGHKVPSSIASKEKKRKQKEAKKTLGERLKRHT